MSAFNSIIVYFDELHWLDLQRDANTGLVQYSDGPVLGYLTSQNSPLTI